VGLSAGGLVVHVAGRFAVHKHSANAIAIKVRCLLPITWSVNVTNVFHVHVVHVEVHTGDIRTQSHRKVGWLVVCARVAVILAALALGAHVAIGVAV
jgi:hypothetical protein